MKRNPYRPSAFALVGVELFLAVLSLVSVGADKLKAATEADSSRSYASVCISVLSEKDGSEVVLTPALEPGPGKSVVAHAVANAPCLLLVAAFNQGDGQLAHDWRPQLNELEEEWEEVTFPEKKAAWRWQTQGENFHGTYSTAALCSSQQKVFIGLGGNNYHFLCPGIDTATTPFLRALDWSTLADAWPRRRR